jgi:carboxyl-terminal processing protease
VPANANFNSLVYNYYLQHKQELEKYKTSTEFMQGFQNDISINLLKTNEKDSFHFNSLNKAEKDIIDLRLKALLARFKWRNTGYYQVLNSKDLVVKKALEIIKNTTH